MTDFPRHHRQPRRVRIGLSVAKVAVVGAIAMVATTTHVTSQMSAPAPTHDVLADRVSQLMSSENCSYTGFGSDTIPETALLRVSTDTVKVVSFERGWAAYEGRKPGTLIAVCLGSDRS